MNFRSIVGMSLMLLAVSCASGRDLPVAEPEIRIAQTNAPAFVQERGGLISIDYLIEITNTADVAITATRVELQSVGDGPYTIRPTPIEVRQTVAPGKSELVQVSAWAYSYGGRAAAYEPVTIRATVRFESAAGSFRIIEVSRVQQN